MPELPITEATRFEFIRVGLIFLAFFLAYLVARVSGRLATRFVTLSRFANEGRGPRMERQQTLTGLMAGVITLLAFGAAIFFCVAQFVNVSTLVWVLGLFSAAFGLGFRPLISDFMTGVFFIFEDTLDVGDKIEILGVEGVVEEVNMRVILVRGVAGELFVVPNGEIRVIRNFSRGKFSLTNITIKIPARDLNRAIQLLEEMRTDALVTLPNLIEPWQVVSETGIIGQTTELTLVAKARFGKGAEMRPRLLAFVQERFAAADIELTT